MPDRPITVITFAVCLLVSGHQATADVAFAPARVGLAPIATRIAHEDCRLLIIGDSNTVKSALHSTVGGVCRTWQPDQFVGRVSSGTPASDEGFVITTAQGGFDLFPRAIYHVGSGNHHVWSNGQDAFVPNRALDMVTTGTGLSSNAHYCAGALTRLDEYPGGDWTSSGHLKARLMFARDPSGLSELRYRALRGNANGPWVSLSPRSEADRAWIDWVDATIPQGSGTVTTQVRTPEGWTSDGQGGASPCPDNCTAGETFYHVGQVVWRTDVQGLQVDSIAEGGFTVEHHLTSAGHYDDEALARYLDATRRPNCFMLLLGQNMTWEQMQDVEGLWRDHVLALMERYSAAALSLDLDADPLFLLVAPWSTNDDSDRHHRMAAVLSGIAADRPDTGFVNLHLVAGAHRYLHGDTLPDGVHYGDNEAADLMAGLMWEQIERELAGDVDVLIQAPSQDLSTLDPPDGSIVHIASGEHAGPVLVAGREIEIRGWSEDTCSIQGTQTGPALRLQEGAIADVRRIHLIGGAGVNEGDDGWAGGCLHVEDSELSLSNVRLMGSEVDRGGALALRSAMCTIRNSTVQEGSASLSGGLVDALDSTLEVQDALFTDGSAAHGGGLHVEGGDLHMVLSSVRNCSAETGGGIALQSAEGSITDGRIRHNVAQTGGGIYIESASLQLEGTEVCSNTIDDVDGEWIDGGGNAVGGNCACPGDLDVDGDTDVVDLLIVLSGWGSANGTGDVDGDGHTDVSDLLIIISAWGPCP
ncbi:MAG: right-handed parallel beta-helix repeat-containing protein [Phycisphaerales bacterium]|nr:right-handed parallel beta-helix repeat-containing protein [Phycisphaerales bacterium]